MVVMDTTTDPSSSQATYVREYVAPLHRAPPLEVSWLVTDEEG